jgi:hypothetical protein
MTATLAPPRSSVDEVRTAANGNPRLVAAMQLLAVPQHLIDAGTMEPWTVAVTTAQARVLTFTGAHDMPHRDEVLEAVHTIEAETPYPGIVTSCREIFAGIAGHPAPATTH